MSGIATALAIAGVMLVLQWRSLSRQAGKVIVTYLVLLLLGAYYLACGINDQAPLFNPNEWIINVILPFGDALDTFLSRL
ncbi:MAG: hypothetical protein PHC60_03850 [Heliobacteriaceae bacterium]|nr:hypothetical protein [Heliobacteriaceae bacterium]MDD4587513.1 hypothetical protein [Heliobacteriaceae bacterium]